MYQTSGRGHRVWLYCSHVPKGKSPKLLQKWVGPYLVIYQRPNHTFKLRRDSYHKILKSLVHAKRLKTYHSPDERPHYFLPEYQDVVLNPEELYNQNTEEIPPPNADQHQANADLPSADDENQQSVQALSLPPKSQQEIYHASNDRRGTHTMFYLENHDGSTTNAKYAYEVPSHLFKPFFKKLEQEISDCKSGKGCEVINRNSSQYFPVSRVFFLKHRPTLFMHHLTPSKARLLKNWSLFLAFKTKLYDHVKLFHTNADL
uniref:Uncharacterized protein n=1 Tax=Magallana gigas TaxID=29159 RepID=A0A8W8JGD3_MAGGI